MAFHRALSLARYNWPLYVACLFAVAVGGAVALSAMPLPIRIAASVGAFIAAWYAVASFAAFHAMFDRSPLLTGAWLNDCTSFSPKTCLQLCVCLEETTLPIERVFPNAACETLDLFDSTVMTEPALARARSFTTTNANPRATPDSLPMPVDSSDLTVVTLAAHEVRDPMLRERLFDELQRVTAPGGRIVIVEHLRNVAALLAFGPGILHFYPRSEWVRLARRTRLELASEFDITPFVHVFVFQLVGKLSTASASTA